MSRPQLAQEVFILGMATLERFFRRKLHPTDRELYYEGVKQATQLKWEQCVRYATMKAKILPKPAELREWMGLTELLTPSEEAQGFVPGTICGLTPGEFFDLVHHGADLPFPESWANELEKACYLDAPYAEPAPENLSLEKRLYWIRKYAEAAAAAYERCGPKEA